MEKFGVYSKSFETYKKFKADCEAMGWVYNERFRKFSELSMTGDHCLYFSPEWDSDAIGDPRFSFTNWGGGSPGGSPGEKDYINLDTAYSTAINRAIVYLYQLDPEKLSCTTLQWFSLLPRGYRERAIANIDERSVIKRNMYNAIGNGFTWLNSPEGHEFWAAVHDFYEEGYPLTLPELPDNTVCK